ncbi:MAG: ABC transporter permease [Oscillospiraceae bacterium]|nr:ABC transporter permease [Oscillospiraceae bacterium]
MYILQNALKNIARNKGRNILMGAIILAIIVTAVISLIINTAAGAVIEEYKTRFGSRVFINPDISKVSVLSGRQSEQTVPLPVVYAALAGSDCLMGADLSCQVPCVSDALLGLGESDDGNAIPISPENGSYTKFPTMNVKGYTNPTQLDDFKEGYRGMMSGNFPVNDNECIVSEDFAALNDIEIGEIIEIAQGMVPDNPLSLLVVGIYFDFTQNQFGAAAEAPAAINVRNDIITNYETAAAFAKSDPRVDTAAYYLKSPGLLSEFESEARAAGLSYDYIVTTDEEAYNRIVGPVLGMAKISLAFVAAVLILGSLILILLASLAIRERKYEIGVLRAMGMKKRKVAFGLVFESFVITAVCLVVGLGIGTAAAQGASDMLLQGQIAAAEPNADYAVGMMYAGMQTDSNAKPLADLDVNLNLKAVTAIILISFLLVLVSSAAGISKITKYEPIKILTA